MSIENKINTNIAESKFQENFLSEIEKEVKSDDKEVLEPKQKVEDLIKNNITDKMTLVMLLEDLRESNLKRSNKEDESQFFLTYQDKHKEAKEKIENIEKLISILEKYMSAVKVDYVYNLNIYTSFTSQIDKENNIVNKEDLIENALSKIDSVKDKDLIELKEEVNKIIKERLNDQQKLKLIYNKIAEKIWYPDNNFNGLLKKMKIEETNKKEEKEVDVLGWEKARTLFIELNILHTSLCMYMNTIDIDYFGPGFKNNFPDEN